MFTFASIVLLLFAGAPGASSAPGADPAPLHVTGCHLVVDHRGPRGPIEQFVVVSFSNDRETAADLARFTVVKARGVAKAFTARGSFTKGVLIADRILSAEGQVPVPSGGGNSDCVLTYVHFADGSSWSAFP